MAGIPQNFQTLSNVLPTYNFIDVLSGTGYIKFYLGKTVDLNLISNYTYCADTLFTGAAADNVAAALQIDNDFDVLLNRPLTLQGYGIVNVPLMIWNGKAASCSGYVIVKLRKWDGVTETEIVDNTSRTFSTPAAANQYFTTLAVDLNIPQTHFKIGEYIRMTILVYFTSPVKDFYSSIIAYGHDPESRTAGEDQSLGGRTNVDWDSSGAVPSELIFQCPVRLNL